MDDTNYTTEHRKGQHLLSEERHEIEVRMRDGRLPYRIAKHWGRPYNTIKNEIKRGTVSLYNGKVQRYKADQENYCNLLLQFASVLCYNINTYQNDEVQMYEKNNSFYFSFHYRVI